MNQSIREIMTPTPTVVSPQTPVRDAIQLMARNHFSGLPVVEGSKVVGVLSETDLMAQETGVAPPTYVMVLDSFISLNNPIAYDRDLHRAVGQTVADVMSHHPITIGLSQSVAEAARVMRDRHIHRLPVLDEAGALVGIVTQGDILRSMAQTMEVVAA
jgi:CBS domain-containing protein